ncbi:retrovirus-related pol polyprotein from transposon TNT 1-94 [Tanacetum coccineum]
MTHTHPNRRFVPQAVLTRSGKINTAGVSVNTAVRPVNIDGSKPTVNHPRPISNAYKKGYSQVTRPFNKYLANKNSIFNEKVNTVRIKDTTARDRAVVSENNRKGVNVVKASGNPQQKGYKEKGVIDSGCSRHMTGNKCYLTEYKDYDGGLVSFGDGKGRISGKCKIKTGTLDFDNVYFCKELKYNLFSVSQICDKKNNVIFTDTECLVLSSDFKLLDESQVLLRVPRKDNIYSVDLKSVVPTKGLTCLFAKAIIDESTNLKESNTKPPDETSGILKTFITEIENQLDHKVKVIRFDNGTEFKNSVMNQFCEMKGIKREFSVAMTPQQNGVAERRNRILIEAARTMVLVIKPHNKTPYELIHGRIPLIDFMKPFGYPVTILNTRDYLGKFDGKADEGFFVRDNIVIGLKDNEEDAEKKPTKMDESGALDKYGEDDQATRSEFERLLQQEKQTKNPNSTNSINNVSTPVSTARPSCIDDDPSVPVNAAEASNAFEEHLFERFSPFKNAFTIPPIFSPISNVTPMYDTRIFSNAYDDEDVGAEADVNNLETTMNVSPIPTTRIDKDHPKNQIIGDFNSTIQTRRMTKISDEHAMKVIQALEDLSWIEAMQEELLQFQFMGFIVYQMDVKSAFLYGSIEEEICVCQPLGFEDPQFSDKVYKVEKALYGLHQAPRAWYETLSTYLIEKKFRRGIIDKTLFIKKDKGDILLVQVYVDDIIFGSTKKSLCDGFEGLQAQQKKDGIFISQDKYVADILKKFYFATVKTTSTPMEANKALVKDEEADSVDVHLYRSMIRSFMYLTTSRPDIMFVVYACARFHVTPKMSHLHAVKRIFRYLKGQPKLGLWYPRDSPFDLEAFFDSDYA